MKTKCPHCRFIFDTLENLDPPFKIGERVRIVKCHLPRHWYAGFSPQFNFTGKIVGYSLIRSDCHANKHIKNKDAWLFDVDYVPFSKKEGCVMTQLWEYQLKHV